MTKSNAGAGWKVGLKKIGAFWQYRFMHRGHLKTGSTKCSNFTEARAWVERYKANLALGEMGLAEPPTLQRVYESWVSNLEGESHQAHRERAQRAVELHLLPALGALRVDQITSSEVDAVMNAYLAGLSPHGRLHTPEGANIVLSYLKILMNHAVRVGLLSKLPFTRRKEKIQQKPRVYLPFEKVQEFLDEVDSWVNLHLSVAIRAQLYFGLRESEALRMKWAWLDESTMTYCPGDTKGREALPLPVPTQFMEILRDLPRKSVWILPSLDGEPHRQQFTRRAIREAGEAVGVLGLTPHRMRATFATLLDQIGTSPYEIQRFLRHKNLSTTLSYVQVEQDRLRAASNRLWARAEVPQNAAEEPAKP